MFNLYNTCVNLLYLFLLLSSNDRSKRIKVVKMDETKPRARTYRSVEGGAITIGELLCLKDKGVSEIRRTDQRDVYALIYQNDTTLPKSERWVEVSSSSYSGSELEESIFDPQVPDYYGNDDI